MEPIPNYNLLQAIDPTKIKLPINERFAKLTLSSNKKQQQKYQEDPDKAKEYKITKEKRDSVVRNISKQFENEIQEPQTKVEQNPLLRSESSKEAELNKTAEEHIAVEDLTMEPLEISEDVEENVEDNLNLLSEQMASLMVDTKPISVSSGSTCSLNVFTDLLTSESQASSISEADKIHIVHHIPIVVNEAVKQETIPLNFASVSNDNLEKTCEITEDEEAFEDDDTEEEDEAITISDTSGSNHEPEKDIMVVSSLPSTSLTSENLSLPSLVDDKAERVAAFLRDVSIEHRINEQGRLVVNDTVDRLLDNIEIDKIQETITKAKQIATADTESMTPDVGDEITPSKCLVEREKRFDILQDLEKIKQGGDGQQADKKYINRVANKETLDETIDTQIHDEETPKILVKSKKPLEYTSPKTLKPTRPTDIYRYANDETQCNTDFTLSQETPKQITSKDNETLKNSRRMQNLETEDFTDFSFKKNSQNDIKEKLDAHRFALEDTMANTFMSDIDDAPKRVGSKNYSLTIKSPVAANSRNNSYASIINSSNEEMNDSVPEVCLTLSETDNEESLAAEKSTSKTDNSDDKKLSNSFLKEDSNDDSEYEQKISKIQMSMANINISAKINIKIHIPLNTSSSEDDQNNDEPSKSDNEEIETQQKTKQFTDQSSTEISHKENSLEENHNNEANEQNSETEINKNGKKFDDIIHHQKSNNDFSLDNKVKTLKKAISCDKNHSYESNIESREPVTPQKACKQIQRKTPKEKLSSKSNPSSSDSSAEIIEDEKFLTEAEKLLTQLYGKSWQTPEVIRTLKRCSPSTSKKSNTKSSSRKKEGPAIKDSKSLKSDKRSLVEESVLDDFSMFRRNIVTTNLDSTRLATPKTTIQQKLETFTEPRNRRKPLMHNTILHSKPQTDRKPIRAVPVAKRIVNKRSAAHNDRWRQLIDNDSNSDGDNASDDETADDSWSKNVSELEIISSSDSDTVISPRPRNKKNNTIKRQKNSNKSDYLMKVLNKTSDGEIVYLDLTKEEVEVQDDIPASPPANHDLTFASRLQDILKTVHHEDRSKLPPSTTKSKRKLFTPNFDYADFENSDSKNDKATHKEIEKEIHKEDEILDDNGVCPFDSLGRPKVLQLFNKQLEFVKIDKPIFPLTPSPKKKNTKINVTPKQKSNEEAIFKTPTTIKSKTLKNFSQTPDYKYSFLKSLDVTVSKSLCHVDALYYRDNYRTKKEELSKILYDMYNEKLFDNKLEVSLLWNKKLLNTAGRCLNKKKLGIRSSVVELSEKVLTSADRLRCTLIHEMCHAASWIFNGEGGHGSTWKGWARKANTVFPEIPKIGVCHQYEIEYKYTYKCTLCAAKSHAHSKSKKVENIRCSYCHGAIEIFLNKKDKDGNVIPTPVKEATGFAKFVKDNYKNFKRDDLKHADIMKLLSNKFASLKVTNN